MPHHSSNVIITISAAHKVWSITSHLLSSRRGSADSQAPQYLCLGVLFPKRKGSGGHLLHVSWQCSTWLRGYQAPSISLRSEHGPLLPEGSPPNQRADSLRRCCGERGEERLVGGGRKRTGRGTSREETVGNDNVCEAISPWQGPPLHSHPGGGLGATRLQPQCSVPYHCPWWPCPAISWPSAKTILAYSGWLKCAVYRLLFLLPF